MILFMPSTVSFVLQMKIVDSFEGYPQKRVARLDSGKTPTKFEDKISLNPVLNSFQQVVRASKTTHRQRRFEIYGNGFVQK